MNPEVRATMPHTNCSCALLKLALLLLLPPPARRLWPPASPYGSDGVRHSHCIGSRLVPGESATEKAQRIAKARFGALSYSKGVDPFEAVARDLNTFTRQALAALTEGERKAGADGCGIRCS